MLNLMQRMIFSCTSSSFTARNKRYSCHEQKLISSISTQMPLANSEISLQAYSCTFNLQSDCLVGPGKLKWRRRVVTRVVTSPQRAVTSRRFSDWLFICFSSFYTQFDTLPFGRQEQEFLMLVYYLA